MTDHLSQGSRHRLRDPGPEKQEARRPRSLRPGDATATIPRGNRHRRTEKPLSDRAYPPSLAHQFRCQFTGWPHRLLPYAQQAQTTAVIQGRKRGSGESDDVEERGHHDRNPAIGRHHMDQTNGGGRPRAFVVQLDHPGQTGGKTAGSGCRQGLSTAWATIGATPSSSKFSLCYEGFIWRTGNSYAASTRLLKQRAVVLSQASGRRRRIHPRLQSRPRPASTRLDGSGTAVGSA